MPDDDMLETLKARTTLVSDSSLNLLRCDDDVLRQMK